MKIDYEALADKADYAVDKFNNVQEAASMRKWLMLAHNQDMRDEWREWAVTEETALLVSLAHDAQDEARQTAREWAA